MSLCIFLAKRLGHFRFTHFLAAQTLTIFAAVVGASGAHADCAPTVSRINVSPTGATVFWVETCAGPGTMQLLQNGSAPNYQNGTLFGDEENLTAFQNGGAVSTTKKILSANSRYDMMRLCAVYKSPTAIYCSANNFAITTSQPVSPNTLQITSTSSTPTSVTFSWSTPSQFQTYHVRLNGVNEQSPKGTTATYAVPPLTPNTRYQVSVEGCTYVGISGNSCSNKWVSTYVTTQPAPPPVPPPVQPPLTSKVYRLKPFGAGDCTLTDGTVTFRSDGTFTFSAQVRTAHTTTSDYWHIEIQLFDGNNRDIENIAEFTGPAMKDAHPGWYNWAHNGTFASSVYSSIATLHLLGRC